MPFPAAIAAQCQPPAAASVLVQVHDFMDLQDAIDANLTDAEASREDAFTRLRVFLPAGPALTLGRRHHDSLKHGNPCAFQQSPGLLETVERARQRGWPVIAADRGGEATAHLPGQVVAFVAAPMPRHRASQLVGAMLSAAQQIAAQSGVQTVVGEGAQAGLWTADGAKLASIGLRWRGGVFTHGMALNVAVDPGLVEGLVLCGDAGAGYASVRPPPPVACADGKPHEIKHPAPVDAGRAAALRRTSRSLAGALARALAAVP